MTVSKEGTLHETISRSLTLERWPEQTIGFMGQAVLNVTDLRYRNDQVENMCPDNITEVHFSTFQPTLEIGGLSRRFSNSVAKLLGCLVEKDPGLCSNSELRDDIARIYDIATNTAGGVMSEGVQALKYWTFDSNGALIFTERGYTGLRDGLLFLPHDDAIPAIKRNPIKNTPKNPRIIPKPKIVSEQYLETRTIAQTGQQYVAWWPDYILCSATSPIESELTSTTPVEYAYNQPQLDLEYISAIPPEEEIKTPINPIIIFGTDNEYVQGGMLAAWDYFFNGGEMPLALDLDTYDAFERAMQVLGGYGSETFSGPVIKLYYGKNKVPVKSDVRLRIKALGESIHGVIPREINTQTITPTEKLSNAPKGWIKSGACRGMIPEIFYPDKDASEYSPEVIYAKNICNRCDAKDECLAFAIKTKQSDGIWGGATERERRVLIRRLRRINTIN